MLFNKNNNNVSMPPEPEVPKFPVFPNTVSVENDASQAKVTRARRSVRRTASAGATLTLAVTADSVQRGPRDEAARGGCVRGVAAVRAVRRALGRAAGSAPAGRGRARRRAGRPRRTPARRRACAGPGRRRRAPHAATRAYRGGEGGLCLDRADL